MGAGVADAVWRVIMGQISVIGTGKGKFQHLHARQTGDFPEFVYLVRQNAQVLSDKGDLGEPVQQDAQQIHTGTLFPCSDLGRFRFRGDGPIAFQAPEMIYPNGIKELCGPLYPANPPAEAVPFHSLPVVKRISPELAVLGEVVRRNARYL